MDDARRSAAIRRGMAAAKAEGRVPTGRPSRLPAEVRARIRLEHEQDRSLRAIAAGLNADGVPTGQGGRTWWASTVQAVLRSLERPPRPSR